MTVKTLSHLTFALLTAPGAIAAALLLLATVPGNAASQWGRAIDNTYGSYYDYAPGYYDSAGPGYAAPTPDYASPYSAGPGGTMEGWGPAYRSGCGAGAPHC